MALTSRQWPWPLTQWCAILPVPVLTQPAHLDSIGGPSIEALYRSGALPVLENAWCKVKIGVAKGKKQAEDKRSDIKEREWQADKARIMKNAHR